MNLPLFPLPIYLLPQGITQLRIFEQRYLTMVKNCENTQGFALVYQENGQAMPDIGSWVDIIDFNSGSDGMLNITVQCKKLVKIAETHRQPDNLLVGKVSPRMHWPDVRDNERCQQLTVLLKSLFEQHTALAELYKLPAFEHDDWVVARWLELLPISYDNKKLFFHPNSFIQAVDFLNTIILDEKNIHA